MSAVEVRELVDEQTIQFHKLNVENPKKRRLSMAVGISIGIGALTAVIITIIVLICNVPKAATLTSMDVYCRGSILENIQLARIFNDSKHFVDMPSIYTPDQLYSAFSAFIAKGTPMSKADAEEFVSQYFSPPGSELKQETPADWTPTPSVLLAIADPNLKLFAKELNSRWSRLARSFDVANYKTFSSVPLSHPFIVPGGRFREFYYWDSFWILDGLLLCDMKATAAGVLHNMMELIDYFGFVPNGARIYFGGRSQPPYFAQMVEMYYNRTGDLALLKKAMPYLDREYRWWMDTRVLPTTDDSVDTLNRFSSNPFAGTTEYGPRPESFAEDTVTAGGDKGLYVQLQAGAESGWDFSTRWLVPKAGNGATLRDIATTDIVPADLNALLFRNELTLARLHTVLGDAPATEYLEAAARRAAQMEALLYDSHARLWRDYNFRLGAPMNGTVYPSAFAPLAARLAGPDGGALGPRGLVYTKEDFLAALPADFAGSPGGVPTSPSTVASGQQWDWPNTWAPLQSIMYEAARNVGAAEYARAIAERWVSTTYCGWKCTDTLYEKYRADAVGNPGSGGEYAVVDGFGWTNGVVLRFLADYGADLAAPATCTC